MLKIVLALFGLPAFASVQKYNIAMHLKSNGKEIASPSVVVQEGEMAKITQRDAEGTIFWEVIATQDRGGILLDFTVGKIDKYGHQSVLSKPRIHAIENESASMTVGAEGLETLTLDVLAKKK